MALVNINFMVLAHAYVLYARALQSRIRGGTFAALVRPALKSGTAMCTIVMHGEGIDQFTSNLLPCHGLCKEKHANQMLVYVEIKVNKLNNYGHSLS